MQSRIAFLKAAPARSLDDLFQALVASGEADSLLQLLLAIPGFSAMPATEVAGLLTDVPKLQAGVGSLERSSVPTTHPQGAPKGTRVDPSRNHRRRCRQRKGSSRMLGVEASGARVAR